MPVVPSFEPLFLQLFLAIRIQTYTKAMAGCYYLNGWTNARISGLQFFPCRRVSGGKKVSVKTGEVLKTQAAAVVYISMQPAKQGKRLSLLFCGELARSLFLTANLLLKWVPSMLMS